MGDNANEAPDPPWFTKPIQPHILTVTATDDQGQTVELPYIRYSLINNEPMILGTARRNGEVYGDYLKAYPTPKLPFETSVNDHALEELYTDYPFNAVLNLALYHLGDAGVLADVHRYRSSFLKLQFMKQESERLTRVLQYVQGEQEQHNSVFGAFIGEVASLREQLVQARVMS